MPWCLSLSASRTPSRIRTSFWPWATSNPSRTPQRHSSFWNLFTSITPRTPQSKEDTWHSLSTQATCKRLQGSNRSWLNLWSLESAIKKSPTRMNTLHASSRTGCQRSARKRRWRISFKKLREVPRYSCLLAREGDKLSTPRTLTLRTQELNPITSAGCLSGRDPVSRRLPRRRESILRELKETHRLTQMSLQVWHLHKAPLIKRQPQRKLPRVVTSVERSDLYIRLYSLLITLYYNLNGSIFFRSHQTSTEPKRLTLIRISLLNTRLLYPQRLFQL